MHQLKAKIWDVYYQLRSRIGSYSASLNFVIVPKVTSALPQPAFEISNWRIHSDPQFNIPGRFDLLIGAEIIFKLINEG